MSTRRPSTRISHRGEQTREIILMAARKLFAERGYHYTSVYDVFEEAEITKGALFHHWKSKEELALSVLQNLESNFEKNFFEVQKVEGRAREKIERLLLTLSELSVNPNWVYGRIFAVWCAELRADEDKVGQGVHALKTRWGILWRDLLRRAQQEHDLRGDISAENLGFLVISAISGVQLMSAKDTAGNQKVAFETLRRALLT
jgi:AcrR family transcriptional regulator